MARTYACPTSNLTLVASSKTVAQVRAPSDMPIRIDEVQVWPRGTSATAAKLDINFAHDDADGTSAGDVTPIAFNKSDAAASLTAKEGPFTGEPSNKSAITGPTVHRQGALVYRPPQSLWIQAGKGFSVSAADPDDGSDKVNFVIIATEA